jgi:hypothetical protein
MFELLALTGGFWFFLFVIFVLVIGVVSTEFDSFFGGGITLILLGAGAQFLFDIPVWSSIVANPFLVIAGLVAYIAVGITYGVYFRYADYIRKSANYIKHDWEEFKKKTQALQTTIFESRVTTQVTLLLKTQTKLLLG